ncbi:MAG: RdgB/HAM1 family non-canonical purine NTP pyrophosphatase [Parachlamydiales bacterium]|jgi:XTP/dITP diphosphohydrolase
MPVQTKLFQLVLATKNIHKLREYKTLLQDLKHLDLLSLKDFPDYAPPEETGKTFRENAVLKAETAARTLQCWTLADDSGLIVPALEGAPGIFSARYAGSQAGDADNRKKLLANMEKLKNKERSAYYECWIALASPEGFLKKCVSATVEGLILDQEKGGGGFGFDPLFVKNDYNKTFAELEDSIKNKISHRRKALDKVLTYLQNLA